MSLTNTPTLGNPIQISKPRIEKDSKKVLISEEKKKELYPQELKEVLPPTYFIENDFLEGAIQSASSINLPEEFEYVPDKSGDHYTFFNRTGQKSGLLLVDSTLKGAEGSDHAQWITRTIREELSNSQFIGGAQALRHCSRTLSRKTKLRGYSQQTHTGIFAAALYVELLASKKSIAASIYSAGNPFPIIYHPEDGLQNNIHYAYPDMKYGIGLGIVDLKKKRSHNSVIDTFFDPHFPKHSLVIRPGSYILAFTDGAYEVKKDGVEYDREGLVKSLHEIVTQDEITDPKFIANEIALRAIEYHDRGKCRDDMTIAVLRVKE